MKTPFICKGCVVEKAEEKGIFFVIDKKRDQYFRINIEKPFQKIKIKSAIRTWHKLNDEIERIKANEMQIAKQTETA